MTERGAAVRLEGNDSFPSTEELLEDDPVTTSNQGLEWPREDNYDKGRTKGVKRHSSYSTGDAAPAEDPGNATKDPKAEGEAKRRARQGEKGCGGYGGYIFHGSGR